tara:strand:- start:4157 stop:5068 length:912 start_codon:yes stop_codon:yes gene_type:complete
MELVKNSGKPIAYYKKGDGRINIIGVDNKHSGKAKKINLDDVATLLEDVIRTAKGRITNKNIEELGISLKTGNPPKHKIMNEIFNDIVNKKQYQNINVIEGGVKPTYDKDEERKVMYICGMSGCGKSTFTSDMIENYHKIFPKNKILFFSNKPYDPVIDKHKFVIRIKLDEDICADPFQLEDLKNSLVIYDDIEYIKEKCINDELDRLRDLILQQGRSYKISFCYISHLLNNYRQSRIILNECHSCILFPQMTTTYSLKYLLEKYFGFSKNDTMKLKTLPSRWVSVNKMPPTVIHDKGIYLIE